MKHVETNTYKYETLYDFVLELEPKITILFSVTETIQYDINCLYNDFIVLIANEYYYEISSAGRKNT